VVTLFVLSRGYTEQQEWVWSLSSTLGREVCGWFVMEKEDVKGREGEGKV
jgi:hypothetical protein